MDRVSHCLDPSNEKKITNVNLKVGVGRTKASSGCPVLREYIVQQEFRNKVSCKGTLDIEELANLGRTQRTCPYYVSKSMVQIANLMVSHFGEKLDTLEKMTILELRQIREHAKEGSYVYAFQALADILLSLLTDTTG
ncbi:putative ATP-dependent RNA helicase DDX1 protein 8 [Spatholobus suberectus]|nr:putative ATP-dependent RNA helicase DDX1 protein 8 [Spatholobus suberectus]